MNKRQIVNYPPRCFPALPSNELETSAIQPEAKNFVVETKTGERRRRKKKWTN